MLPNTEHLSKALATYFKEIEAQTDIEPTAFIIIAEIADILRDTAREFSDCEVEFNCVATELEKIGDKFYRKG